LLALFCESHAIEQPPAAGIANQRHVPFSWTEQRLGPIRSASSGFATKRSRNTAKNCSGVMPRRWTKPRRVGGSSTASKSSHNGMVPILLLLGALRDQASKALVRTAAQLRQFRF
jgi:hypothetical protein